MTDTVMPVLPVLHNQHAIDTKPTELGVTVRLGEKWSLLAPEGTVISLCECDGICVTYMCGMGDTPSCDVCKVVGTAEVVDIYMGEFRDIPARFVENEHEERSRIYTGLYESMDKAYGQDFDEASRVTVLSYLRLT